ncbi:Multidrug resistance-associated protein [Blattamonas nauphoetae]|uniref:Multidrug resistance-associated protein n=1 Tax=Blattamonas nauphoetae TaxID=2049346 RepID=A0ABQ9XYP9_9EUKA|nr:Multidrug resistance-associated protein [Blattamonas nauphoetae]
MQVGTSQWQREIERQWNGEESTEKENGEEDKSEYVVLGEVSVSESKAVIQMVPVIDNTHKHGSDLIFICRCTPVTTSDIPPISDADKTLKRYPVFESRWMPLLEAYLNSDPKARKTPRLFRTILRSTLSPTVVLAGICIIIGPAFEILMPWLSKLTLAQSTLKLTDPTVPMPLVPCILMILFPALQQILDSFGYRQIFHLACQIRSIVAYALYSKLFRLNIGSGSTLDTGKLLTLLTSDCSMIGDQFQLIARALTFPAIFLAPFIFLLVSWKWVALIALAAWLIFLPIQLSLARGITHQTKKYLSTNDRRNKLQNEILQGIRIVKLTGMEEMFYGKINIIREEQVKHVARYSFLVQITHGMYRTLPQILNLATISTLVVVTKVEQKDFARDVQPYTLYLLLMTSPAFWLPGVVQGLSLLAVSMKRVSSFLILPEMKEEIWEGCQNAGNAVEIEDGEFSWAPAPIVPERKEELKRRQKAEKKQQKEAAKQNSERQKRGKDSSSTELSSVTKQASETPQTSHTPSPSPSFSQTPGQTPPAPESKTVLFDINLSIPANALTMVIGEVGSGKSSLAAILTKEIERKRGTVRQSGSIAYCPQVAWIMNGTIRDNILMGRQFNEDEYNHTIKVCSLEKDLQTLAAGDETAIGEKGVNLSGGQKARIQLARAVYSSSDVILLDDPLSAVDAHVGKFLMDECIGGVLKGRTVILMTNQVQFVDRADFVIVLKEGRVMEKGKPDEIRKTDQTKTETQPSANTTEHSNTLNNSDNEQPANPSADQEDTQEETMSHEPSKSLKQEDPEFQTELGNAKEEHPPSSPSQPQHSPNPSTPSASPSSAHTAKQIISSEEHTTGGVPLSVYWYYLINSIHPLMIPVFFIVTLSISFMIVITQYWVGVIGSSKSWSWFTYEQKFFAFGVLTVIMVVVTFLRAFVGHHAGKRGSRRIHTHLLKSILSAPVAFFDTTPLGRILNRLTGDLAILDQFLHEYLVLTIVAFANLCGQTVIVALDTPLFTAIGGTAVVFFCLLLIFYVRAARELQRIELISRSPVVSHFSQTLSGTGLSAIRSFKQEDSWKESFANKLDDWGARWIVYKQGSKWSALIASYISSFFNAGVCFLGWYFMEPAKFSVALGAGMNFVLMGDSVVQNGVQLETRMASLQRVKFYAEKVPQEIKKRESAKEVRASWPEKGEVVFENVSFRYRPGLPRVLRDVSFHISGGEKIGVCGRTGAGKSSLIFVLFRLSELDPSLMPFHLDPATGMPIQPDPNDPEANSGRVFVDGVDLSDVDINHVRQSFAIIPQDPTLFTGTVRSNLDLGSERSDDKIWEVLEMIEMRDVIAGLPLGLDSEVTEGGSNFSVGQRQLLCFARAILNDRKVIVMDEATANVDVDTDAKIQRTIREQCTDKTVIVIAHRLNTIMDSDRILVMDNGSVAEFDTPFNLLAQSDSAFSSLTRSMQ